MRIVLDAPEDAFVDLGQADIDLVPGIFGELVVAQFGEIPRAVAIVTAQSAARIVESAVLVPGGAGIDQAVWVGIRR